MRSAGAGDERLAPRSNKPEKDETHAGGVVGTETGRRELGRAARGTRALWQRSRAREAGKE